MFWDIMCNISTDGTSLNEPEISTGHHTLDKGKQHFSSAWCVSTREINNRDHFYTSFRWRAMYNDTGKYFNVESKIFGFFSFQNDSVW